MLTELNTCTCCGSDCVITRGAGRVIELHGATVRVPESWELLRCHGCGRSYPTGEQLKQLLNIAERDWLGDGGRGGRPVHRGT